MWIKYNANPVANRVEDCIIRAVAVALDISWDDAFDLVAEMPSRWEMSCTQMWFMAQSFASTDLTDISFRIAVRIAIQ